MAPIFFIHLQKTGGTSINHAACEYFSPERVLMLYGRGSQWTSPAARKIMLDGNGSAEQRLEVLSNYIVQNKVAFFSSHLSAARLRCFDPARAFTILRDPVERVISQYSFFRRKGRTQVSLKEFVERPEWQNNQSNSLRGLDLEALGAVGVLERSQEFWDRLNKQFGLHLAIAHRKRGGILKDVRARTIGRPMRRRIEMLNQEDAALYQLALKIFDRRAGSVSGIDESRDTQVPYAGAP